MNESWPSLPLAEWRDTCDTLHMWMQIVGKVRMELSPHRNHWWSTTLYVSSHGLTTSPIPFPGGIFEMEFDFLASRLDVRTSGGKALFVPLKPRTVADFYAEVMSHLNSLGINIKINPIPQEFPNPIPFPDDRTHAFYDPEYARRFWHVLIQADRLLKEYQSDWMGKASPVHLFWGSMDICATRFSGRRAPERPGADHMTREAYSHECISVGFWPGGGPVEDAAFYAYTAPAPPGYGSPVQPATAAFNRDWNEYLLMYEDVRTAPDPDQAVLDFFRSTYAVGADLAGWDRNTLERQ